MSNTSIKIQWPLHCLIIKFYPFLELSFPTSSFFTPFLPHFQPPNTRKERRKDREERDPWVKSMVGKGVMLSLDYFLLIRDIKFVEASLIFAVRISNFFFVHDYLINCHQQQPTKTQHFSRALAFIYSLRSSQDSKRHTTAETICTWQKSHLC